MTEYDRVYAGINLDNIRDNLINLKGLVEPETKALAIIKSDGYGHGACAIADYIDDIVDGYGVAVVDEAVELREHGINKMILILGYTPESCIEDVVVNNISQTVYDYGTALSLSQVAVRHNMTAKVHIKLDTGMGRLGFPCNAAGVEEIIKISGLPGLKFEGCFSHFSKADESDLTYTGMQYDRYKTMLDMLAAKGITFDIRHICNSAAAMQYREAAMDMVRYGIAIYGLYPSDEVDKNIVELKPAMELKSVVSFVKEVEPGTRISYGGTYEAADKRIIATIPVGYADGYPRAQSNTGRVIIKGKYAPITGRVCMDQMMVDVTDIPGVKKGDTVTLVGTDGNCRISVEDIADSSSSFNYEFVCGISKRVPRKYED